MLGRTHTFVLASLLVSLAACSSDDKPDALGGALTDASAYDDADAGLESDSASGQDARAETGAGDAATEAATEAGTDPKFDRFAAMLEKERASLKAPGAAAAIVQGGQVTFATGVGVKDPSGDEPVAATTLFRIGSLNKMLTAAALLQLVEQGQVDLNEPITTYLPDLSFARDATWAPSIAVKHLLTHESAIVDYLTIDSPMRDDDDLSSYMQGPFAAQQYLMAPPGRFYNYSNPGYMFAGLVTETVAGSYYRDALRQRVLSPLGMDRTMFLGSEVLADGDYASGKTVHWDTGKPTVAGPDDYDNAWARPAGYAFSSVLDLAKFLRFLIEGNDQVLSDSLRTAMFSPQVNTEEFLDRISYGYGLIIQQGFFLGSDFYDTPIVAHSGAISGFSADLYYLPHCDLGMITLANTDGAYFTNSLVVALEDFCTLPEPSQAPDLTINPDDFDRYAGDYDDPFNAGPMTLKREGDKLTIQMPLLDAYDIPYEAELEPMLPGNFILTVQGVSLPLTIILDANGQGEYVRTRPFVARRQPPARGPKPVLKTREEMMQFVSRLRAAALERPPVIRLPRP